MKSKTDIENKTVHLGERDCSVHIRMKKPYPVLTEEQERSLENCQNGRADNYEGAGTVEFIYENGKFYFLK